MVTVKTKKELIKAIDAGEKHIYIASKKLYIACKLAEKYHNTKEILSEYISSLMTSLILTETMHCVISEGTIVVITLATAVTAISIIAILKERKLKIEVKQNCDGRIEGEINIY